MNIGFYLLDIEVNNHKQSNILNGINQFCESRPYDNIVLFNNTFDTIDLDHKYYILHINQAKFFKGILFTFDLKSALLTKTFAGPTKQVLVMDSPEWQNNRSSPYRLWSSVYNNPDFELVVHNKDMKNLCEICWKKPLDMILEINDKSINEIISKLGLEYEKL